MLRSARDYCVNRKNPETRTQNPETGNWKRETGIKPVIGNQFSVLSSARGLFMSLPVIAITNASTCLTDLAGIDGDSSVAATDHCGFQSLLGRGLPVGVPGQGAGTPGRMVADFRDNPDQAGALGYHELTSRGTPLGKVVESDKLGYEIDGVMVSDFITPAWFEPTRADRVDFKRRIAKPLARRGRIHLRAGCGRGMDASCGAGRAFSGHSAGKPKATAQPGKGGVEEKSAPVLITFCANAHRPW